ASSTWSTRGMHAHGWTCAPRTLRACPLIRRAPSPTSHPRRILCSRFKRRRGRAKRTHFKRCPPPRSARTRKGSRSRPPRRAPTGKAVDEAMRGGAGDRGLTVAQALHLIDDDQLGLDLRTVIVVDEASMVATPEMRRLLEVSTAARTKMVLVGDAYQLVPVKA